MADPGTMLGMKAIGWVTAPIISELFKKCANYLSFHASEKLRQLGPKVLLLERAMEVFVEFPNRSRVEQLFNDLKNAFYEAEDILDDIEYHCLEKKIQDDKFISDGSVSLHKRCWLKKLLPKGSVLKNKATGMSKKDLKESLEKIDEIINNAYKFVEHLNLSTMIKFNGNQAAPASSEGAVTTGAPPPIVFGRDKERDKIMEMLHEKEGDDQPNTNGGLCYSVIGIHGIGGSGKSTLAQLVYAREKDQQGKKDDHFDLVMWVHVSQNFSVGDIFKEIFEAATGNSCPQLNNLNTLQDKLEEKLHGKRFLLVLDDVWSNIRDERQHWNLRQIISPLKAGEAGSKILVTSRTEDALLVLGATKLRCVPISDLDNDVFLSLLMYYALEGAILDDHVRRRLNVVGADIAKKLKGSPLSARIVGRRLGMRPDAEFWRTVRNEKFVGGTMGALWWSYKHLDQHARRCFAYCSIFPRKHHLQCDELVELWVAEGFISTNEGEEMEDVGREYFYELVSTLFLQPGGKDENGKDYFVIHDLLHDLAGMVAGNDCFRIENGSGLGKEVWTGEVPRDVRHLYIHRYTGAFMTRNILELKNLRTLMIYNAGWGLAIEEVIEIIFKGLLKLRVLTINLPLVVLSVPESVCQLKHLRYLSFGTETSSLVILPSTLTKLYHIQLLHFGGGVSLDSSSASLTNLLHLSFYSGPDILNIGRLTSLQTIPSFRVRKEPGFEVKQLRDLDKLRGSLCINGLENVESNEQAVEANLSAKERLTELTLNWDGDSSCPEVEAEVLEGLCPPIWLETLCLSYYKGSRYPNWMVDNQSGGPKDLQELEFWECSQLGPAPKLEGFIHLRSLWLWGCSWDSLPSNMENLVLLKKLMVDHCFNISWLPTLPQSLEVFNLVHCNDEFMQSCETIGHPNWQKIEHVPKRNINDPVDQDKVIRAYNRMTYRKYYGVGPE